MAGSLVWAVLLVTGTLSRPTIADNDKRILLSDPTYVVQEINRLQSEVQELQVLVATQQTSINQLLNEGGQGVVYTRWGRQDCPPGNDTHLVYSGTAGGSYSSSYGAAANALCMPPDPLWGAHKNTRLHYPAYVYGAEYEDTTVFGMPDRDQDVPCTVCRNSAHSVVSMVPGRTTCYPGWTESYGGILTAGYPSDHAASEYLCLDAHPQALRGGGDSNDYGKQFSAVLSRCGSLPCPPYEDGKVLSCVVCMM